MNKIWFALCFYLSFQGATLWGQTFAYNLPPDAPNIHAVTLLLNGKSNTMNLIRLNSHENLELNFDDFNNNPQYYYYTLQLCNSQWQPVNTPTIRYLDGNDIMPINTFQYSMVSTPYIHYKAVINNEQMHIKRSGNYLLKVCLNGDTSQIVFERRIIAIEEKWKVTLIGNASIALTPSPIAQTIQAKIEIPTNQNIDIARQISIAIYQNGRWDNAYFSKTMPVMQGIGQYIYGFNQDIIFPAGNGWQFLDISSSRTYPNFTQYVIKNDTFKSYVLQPQSPQKQQVVLGISSQFGGFSITNTDNQDKDIYSNYVYIYFSYKPKIQLPVYLIGALNNYAPAAPLYYDKILQTYVVRLLLKQGYYDYNFVTKLPNGQFSFDNTEGNDSRSPNEYTALLYFWDYADMDAERIYALDRLYFNVNN